MVNEIYADQAAVDAHNANPRMGPLRVATGPLLKSRRLIWRNRFRNASPSRASRPLNSTLRTTIERRYLRFFFGSPAVTVVVMETGSLAGKVSSSPSSNCCSSASTALRFSLLLLKRSNLQRLQCLAQFLNLGTLRTDHRLSSSE
jgi:hypothetical protein